MKWTSIIALVFGLLMTACQQKQVDTTVPSTTEVPLAPPVAVVGQLPKLADPNDTIEVFEELLPQQVWIENRTTHFFSNPTTKDTFRIWIEGESMVEGEVMLFVTTADGQPLIHEIYPAEYLLGYGVEQNLTVAEKEEVMLQRVKEFFAEDRFSQPAIAPDEVFRPEFSEQDNWDVIKAIPEAIGFTYTIGLESTCSMAYAEQEHQVLVYHCCC